MKTNYGLPMMCLLLAAIVLSCSAPSGGAPVTPHTVTYNANGATGSAPADSTTYQPGATVTVLGAGGLSWTGYTFAGWTTSTTGPGSSFAAGATFAMGNADVNLYGVWIPNSLNLLVSSSGASITIIGYSSAPSGSLAIPQGVTSIDTNVFQNCTLLTSVTIPPSVTSIGDGALQGCTSLLSVTYTPPCALTSIGYNMFAGDTALTTFTIPPSVTTIGLQAFFNAGLTSLTIPSTVTVISGNAFMGCTHLTGITIPSSVPTIGDGAFSGDTGLTSLTISPGVTTIRQDAFQSCSGLTSVTIPSSVTAIGAGAFIDATSLTTVYEQATIPPTPGGQMFFHDPVTIHVPGVSLSMYLSAAGWNAYTIVSP